MLKYLIPLLFPPVVWAGSFTTNLSVRNPAVDTAKFDYEVSTTVNLNIEDLNFQATTAVERENDLNYIGYGINTSYTVENSLVRYELSNWPDDNIYFMSFSGETKLFNGYVSTGGVAQCFEKWTHDLNLMWRVGFHLAKTYGRASLGTNIIYDVGKTKDKLNSKVEVSYSITDHLVLLGMGNYLKVDSGSRWRGVAGVRLVW